MSDAAGLSKDRRVRRFRSISEKLEIVQLTLKPGASVAQVAQAHGVNANQLFSWRKQYRAGQLCEDEFAAPGRSVQLLPVSVADDEPLAVEQEQIKTLSPRLTMNIEIPGHALVSVEGDIDATFIRAVLQGLRG